MKKFLNTTIIISSKRESRFVILGSENFDLNPLHKTLYNTIKKKRCTNVHDNFQKFIVESPLKTVYNLFIDKEREITMTTEKTATYTAEQTASAMESYAAGKTVEQIAETLGKSVRSVIAKLSREKVYVANPAPKVGRVTKAMLVSAIAVKFGVTDESLESLEKASKEALEILAG